MIEHAELQTIYKKIGYEFRAPELLIEALTHPSLRQHRHHKDTPIYERLEFLGDGILGMVISDLLFCKYRKDDEGDLAKKRAYLVSSEALAGFGKQLNISEHIIMADGEVKNGGRNNQSTLEDIIEAIIAAIYLDSDYLTTKTWIQQLWQHELSTNPPIHHDTKTMLQEWSQGLSLPIPRYTVIDTQGSAHAPLFTVEVFVPKQLKFTAKANNIKKAEKQAARLLLQHLGIINQ